MKIDSDLRIAIKSAEKAQNRDSGAEERAKKEAVSSFLKSGTTQAKMVLKAHSNYKAAMAKCTESRKAVEKLGLRFDSESVTLDYGSSSQDTFEKKTKTKIKHHQGPWRADRVILELLSADPNEGNAILKKYGIKWN